MKKTIIALLSAIIVLLGGSQLLGAAPGGMAADVASSSLVQLGTSAKVVFATSTNCVSRVITSVQSDADIWFDLKDEVPAAGTSHLLASSTDGATMYDGGLWGCGSWRMLSSDEGDTIRVTEFTSFR